ncbi:hypothetical protein [Kingella oralis]
MGYFKLRLFSSHSKAGFCPSRITNRQPEKHQNGFQAAYCFI